MSSIAFLCQQCNVELLRISGSPVEISSYHMELYCKFCMCCSKYLISSSDKPATLSIGPGNGELINKPYSLVKEILN